jgi:phage baseplate assembly protein W
MTGEYYSLPIQFKKITELKNFGKSDLQTSVAQMIHLTLVTSFGESRYNRQFGCLVWEFDFETIYNVSNWKEKVMRSVTDTLAASEKRLNNIQVTIEMSQEETGKNDRERGAKIKALRKRLDVRVTGNFQKTNEVFVFSEPIYVSPISFD